MFSATYSQVIADFKVNDDQGRSDQQFPNISADGNGNFVITWSDFRNGNTEIYAQRYSSAGAALDTNFKVNDGAVLGNWGWPKISSDSSGNFVITWGDERNGDGDVYAQRYSSEGAVLGNNFRVYNDISGTRQYDPCITTDGNGNFVITWYDTRNGGYDVYAQRYSSEGIQLGDNFKVNDGAPSAFHDGPFISSDDSGNFVITWSDSRNGNYHDIYAQRYSSEGVLLGNNFKVNNGEGQNDSPKISSDSSGNFVITWRDYRNGDSDIYAQRYSSEGVALGDNFKVNDDDSSTNQSLPHITTDGNGNFVITWDDRRNGGYDIYAQRYSSDGSTIGDNYKVTTVGSSCGTFLWNGRIYSTWMTNSGWATGYDIWANVLDWNNPTGISDKDRLQILSSYQLSQNYPNPFNPTTTIEFSIPRTEFVTLKIYNLLGQEVVTLVSENLTAGNYKYTWDAGSLASGVYMYKIETGSFTQTRKLILMK